MHCILLLWESQKRRSEPNILTWCCAAFRRAFFPQSLPRFYPSDRRAASIEKNKTPYSAVSASGLFTPFLCICANAQTVFRMRLFIFCTLLCPILHDLSILLRKKRTIKTVLFCCGTDLFSREAALQVFSARTSLTTVFGMGTGGSSS